MKLSGWGRYPVVEAALDAPRDEAALRRKVRGRGVVARGNGRAYGDSAIGRETTLHMRHFNRMISFDPVSGTLVAEAGVILGDIIEAFLPRGWFPRVTPGTKFVTLGGMIAADVHGKNHHREGSFRNTVEWIEVMDATGEVQRTHPGETLFDWTLGGMGLTGVILRAAIRLRRVESGWIRQTTRPAGDLAEAIGIFEESAAATYSVAWIDCLTQGRSLVMLGEHALRSELSPGQAFATPKRRRKAVPLDMPGLALNGYSVRAFNALYYRAGRQRAGESLVDWDRYFYPLDAILGWNRIYGRRGFTQFQCVLPLASAEAGLTALLAATAAAGEGSFLAVLKRLGPGAGPFSFPMEGYTLALDFPMKPTTLALLDRLDAIVLDHGGRFYLAKDARMTSETHGRSDPRAEAFAQMRAETGWSAFQSVQSARLAL